MNSKQWKTYVIWIVVTEVVGILAGILSSGGARIYGETIAKPPLSPPAILFPIVWSVLYALMGIGAARIYMTEESRDRSSGLNLYIVQLILNFFWPLIFFNAQAFGFAFFWLVLLWIFVFMMNLTFRKVDPLAAKLQIPYLIWLSFALYLNLGVWILNK